MGRAGRLAAADVPAATQEWTPLRWAVHKGHLETLKALLDQGAAVDARDVSGAKGRGRELRDGQGVGRQGRRGMRGSGG